jgi:5-carboxymethyl-2-hydroxymuconate isomerase
LHRACETIFEAITEFLQPIYDTRAISIGFDVTELDNVYSGKKNNIYEKLASRGK